jgi:glycerol-3-phosphate dehydrogenase
LIHGGLRYLESFQVGLVRECLRERAILLSNAPELVRLVPFYIPVYQNTVRRPWKIKAGLALYRLLDNWRSESRFTAMPPQQWRELTGLRQQGLQAVFQYYDAQTDDVALTKAVLHSAQQLEAEVLVPAEMKSAEIHARGCTVQVVYQGQSLSCECKVLVNAAGPWVNQVLGHCQPASTMLDIEYVQGTHIILHEPDREGVFYIEALQDQRAIFVMPWYGNTLIGTTETVYHGDLNNVRPLDQELSYLLETYNYYFPVQGGTDDRKIIDAYAGVRVLPKSDGKPFGRSRDTRLLSNNEKLPRMITLYGGKLTAYRSTAERVMKLAQRSLPARRPRADTRTLPLVPVD